MALLQECSLSVGRDSNITNPLLGGWCDPGSSREGSGGAWGLVEGGLVRAGDPWWPENTLDPPGPAMFEHHSHLRTAHTSALVYPPALVFVMKFLLRKLIYDSFIRLCLGESLQVFTHILNFLFFLKYVIAQIRVH